MASRAEYFEGVKQKSFSLLQELIMKNDYFFIDTCSLMSPHLPLFAANIIPLLKKYNKKLTLCSSVNRELHSLMTPSGKVDNMGREIYAYMGLYTLEQIRKEGVLDYVDDGIEQGAGPADLAFQHLFIALRPKYKLLLITQDGNLTASILRFNQDLAVNGHTVDVRLINQMGFLESKTEKGQPQQKEKKPVKAVNVPQVPTKKEQPKHKTEEKKQPAPVASSLTEKDARQYVTDGKLYVPGKYTSIGFINLPEITMVYIPDSVTTINSQAFRDAVSLSRIIMPPTLCAIGQSAFLNCKSLLSITIPQSVTIIENGVFKNCTKLRSVHLHSGVTMIGSNAFYGCTSLTEIVIPYSVTEIAETAFANCDVTVRCYANSYAHRFVIEHEMKYSLIDG